MAKPVTRRGTKLRILQGNGGGSETFTAYCALNAKTVRFQSQTNDFYVPDCDTPDAPAWREIVKSGRSMTVSGSGILNMTDLTRYQAAYNDDDVLNYRVELDGTNTVAGGHWSAPFAVTELEVTGNDEDLVQVSITLESNGAVVWVPAT
ncbi:MAG: hypothetical protein DI629_12115 [Mesorhizobium amorphae]|nr:MAG: hypothetical protein DI629_12115 [Mesorhizobium amorphae]